MWKRIAIVVLVLAALSTAGVRAQKPAGATAPPVVVLDTVKGVIEFELFPQDAPKSVDHILALVTKDFYRGLRFHWVTPGIIQVGDPQTRNMQLIDQWGRKGSGDPVGVTEFSKRSFVRGSVGLGFINDAKLADSQFFITKADSTNLNGKYTMIGRVTKGMDVVDKIEVEDILKTASVKK